MARVSDYLDDDFESDESPSHEPIRKNTKPVNEHHDFLKRTENAINRHRARREKESRREW